MPHATVDDVKRVLQITDDEPTRDEQLRMSLEAAESFFVRKARRRYDESAATTAKFYDVPEDATLHLPNADATVTAVRLYSAVAADPSDVTEGSGYEVAYGTQVILRPSLLVEPFEGAVGQRLLGSHGRVEVDYTPSGVVPQAVRDGIALLAASMWRQWPRLAGSYSSESIGDYSYSASQAPGGGYYDGAMELLRPFFKREVKVA